MNSPTPVRVSVPGKLILMGEHAAVYHRPALVTAFDRRLRLEVCAGTDAGVSIENTTTPGARRHDWSDILDLTRRTAARWQEFSANPSPASFDRVRGTGPDHLLQMALGEAALFCGDETPPALRIRLASDLPVGAGFGSSAALAVAVVSAYLSFRGVALEHEELHRLSLEVERRQHGTPSGVDNACVLSGGTIWARGDSTGSLHVTPIESASPFLSKLRVFHSGTPAESSGAMVAAVRERWAARPRELNLRLDRLEHAARRLRTLLTSTDEDPDEIRAVLGEGERQLEELGVVPVEIRERIRRVEAAGGAAKISGAGALSGPGAGSLLVYHPEPGICDDWDFLASLTPHPAKLGGAGLRTTRGREVS